MKAYELVAYCYRCERLPKLEEIIKSERPEKYEKFKDQLQLKNDEEIQSVLEEIQAGTSQYANVIEGRRVRKGHRLPSYHNDGRLYHYWFEISQHRPQQE